MDFEEAIKWSMPVQIRTVKGWHDVRETWRCERFLYWQQVDPIYEELSVQDYLLTTVAGHTHDAYAIVFLRRVLLARDIRLKDARIQLSGEADFLIELDGEQFIVELKTCNDFAFSSHKNRAGDYWHEGYNRKPSEHHIIQLQCYLNMADIELGILEYYNRNDGRRCSYLVQKDKELYGSIAKKLTRVNRAIKRKSLPKRDLTLSAKYNEKGQFEEGSWQCNPKYCQYSKRCWLESE